MLLPDEFINNVDERAFTYAENQTDRRNLIKGKDSIILIVRWFDDKHPWFLFSCVQ
jgi:hypothetical protein